MRRRGSRADAWHRCWLGSFLMFPSIGDQLWQKRRRPTFPRPCPTLGFRGPCRALSSQTLHQALTLRRRRSLPPAQPTPARARRASEAGPLAVDAYVRTCNPGLGDDSEAVTTAAFDVVKRSRVRSGQVRSPHSGNDSGKTDARECSCRETPGEAPASSDNQLGATGSGPFSTPNLYPGLDDEVVFTQSGAGVSAARPINNLGFAASSVDYPPPSE